MIRHLSRRMAQAWLVASLLVVPTQADERTQRPDTGPTGSCADCPKGRETGSIQSPERKATAEKPATTPDNRAHSVDHNQFKPDLIVPGGTMWHSLVDF